MYYIGSILLVIIGVAHSYLGERYILIRLFRRDDLPKLFGGSEFTKNTLRFAWHITTVAWWGFAAILFHLARSGADAKVVGNIIGVTFLIHFVIALFGSKGRHLSWICFLLVGVAAIYASNT
ncbi:hypothetical protein [Lacimicrobium alkaliphilum]|uniref:Uncharacterized protein n=1 Tax=Lacimicrobium alkaliphilum TaxID=1526571 RepID=A0A0U2Z8Q3_9ALTE|nr:hypothetical protein [Lacimicrobium alkaliphilum]ALS98836.1 hypothetical protein AT746_11520 [Lacimicrobium alkaliphilum]